MQTESGPVTVMVLVHERVSKPLQFDEQGYRGVIVPVPGHGSLAVLGRVRHRYQDRRRHRCASSSIRSSGRARFQPSPSKSISRRALAASVG